MSSNKKTASCYSSLNNKMSAKKNLPGAVGSGRKKAANDTVSTSQNKTPNKSGLTPVRPMKSPGTGIIPKSGLKPVHPRISPGLPKSPFYQAPKQKSGLQPIKPKKNQQVDQLNCSSLIARRKSGLQPIKPAPSIGLNTNVKSTLPCYTSRGGNDTSMLESKRFTFAAPKLIPKGEKSSGTVPHSASRRKSGLAPIKQFSFGAASGRQSIRMPPSNNSTQGLVSRIEMSEPVESTPSLKVISEDSESPGDSQSNMSGICQLDDSADMSVVLKPRTGKSFSSRIPLPRTNLDNAHFSSSGITNARFPRRALYIPEDDDNDRTSADVLKDGSSKANIVDGIRTFSKGLSLKSLHTSGDNQADGIDREEKSLLHRKKELETSIRQMSSEVEEIDQRLRLLQHERKDQPTHVPNNKECEDEFGSPFADVVSPVSTGPLELLTLAKSKQPDNIYNSFRQSCSFLKTPQHSAFLRQRYPQLLAHQPKDSPNVSQRLQKQLADLFAE